MKLHYDENARDDEKDGFFLTDGDVTTTVTEKIRILPQEVTPDSLLEKEITVYRIKNNLDLNTGEPTL